MMVAYNTNKWVLISVDFEFTAAGTVLSSLSSSFGNLDSVSGQAQNTDRWPSYFVNWYYKVMTFTVYYFSTFVIKFHEHGSFRAVNKKEMIKMDILVHLLIITAWCTFSCYCWCFEPLNCESALLHTLTPRPQCSRIARQRCMLLGHIVID